jgi:hypothetical protein
VKSISYFDPNPNNKREKWRNKRKEAGDIVIDLIAFGNFEISLTHLPQIEVYPERYMAVRYPP